MKGCVVVLLLLLLVAGVGTVWVYTTGYTPDFLDTGAGRRDTETTGGVPVATVAVEPGDSARACLERNLTPELLLALYREDTTLSNDIIRTCLEQDLPQQLVGLIDPIIQETSRCASERAQQLTTEEVLVLGQQGQNAEKDAIVRRVSGDILRCVARSFPVPTGASSIVTTATGAARPLH
jgi:hypothetical protein